VVTAWGGVEPGLARTRQADRVGRTLLVGPVHSVKCPRGLSSDPWDERTSVTAESQSTNIRRSPTILRAVSISATFRCSVPTRQTLQPVGERGQRQRGRLHRTARARLDGYRAFAARVAAAHLVADRVEEVGLVGGADHEGLEGVAGCEIAGRGAGGSRARGSVETRASPSAPFADWQREDLTAQGDGV